MATSSRLDELQQRFQENPRRYFAPLANELRKLGDLDQAVALCRAHLPQQPGHVSGHIVLAQSLLEAGVVEEARATFESALDLDPENLIALRSLGDMARRQGDPLTARQWYERVLEADPRNDEIATLINDLAASGAAAVVPGAAEAELAEPIADTEAPNVGQAAHDEAPAVPADEWLPDVARAVPADALTPAEPAADTADETVPNEPAAIPAPADAVDDWAAPRQPELATGQPRADAVDDWAAPRQPELATGQPDTASDYFYAESLPAASEPAVPLAADAEAQPQAFEALDLSAFEAVADGEDVEPLSAMPTAYDEREPAPTAYYEQEPAQRAPDTLEPEPAAEREADYEAAAEPRGPAPGDDWFAAAESAGHSLTSETAGAPVDLDAAFRDVLPNSAAAPAPEAPVPMEEELSQDLYAGWDVHESAAIAADDAAFVAPGDATVVTPQHVDALIGRTPDDGVPAIDVPSGAFVTETMAELYLQQGFREEALAVYQRLLARSPDDGSIRARVHALEVGEEPALAGIDAAVPVEEVEPPPALRMPRADAAGQSMRAFLSVLARRRAPLRTDERATPPTDEARAPDEGGLSALLGAQNSADEGSASVLAAAFVEPNAVTALPGRPSRAADAELSLREVFKGRGASFDEFFSTERESTTADPLDGDGSDMLQFTAWLEGLRKK